MITGENKAEPESPIWDSNDIASYYFINISKFRKVLRNLS
jgi:hypothetical protein